jgi:predicted transcriptional regulator
MARPSKELTERELQVMHAFWHLGEAGVAEARDELIRRGQGTPAYTTVATLVKILAEKGFLRQINEDRPFRYQPARTYEEVSRRLLDQVVEHVFRGSREHLLLRLVERRALSPQERAILERFLNEELEG